MRSSHVDVIESGSPATPDLSAPALFALAAARCPTAEAVVFGTAAMSYAELSARSTVLSEHLRSLGVKRDVVVGLCMERSIAFVVGALGIMKAGGAYLPLDPSHPSDRLSFQLADADAPIVLIANGCETSVRDLSLDVVALEADGTLVGEPTLEAFSPDIRSEDLAYVIYTSGSTGRPKGVEITHGGLSNLIHWHRAAFRVTGVDRASHLSAVSFDAAVWELWPYLAAGASVHVVDNLVAKDPVALRDWLLAQRITIGFTPTPLTERLMDLNWPSKTSLKVMLTGADRLHQYPKSSLPFEVVNNYGPTECTVVATSGTVPVRVGDHRLPTIGEAIANATVYILDEEQLPVSPGEDGEIWVGGRGLARGYRNLPDLTAEKFVRDPFDPRAGARIYRTGDRGRFLPDGQIAFLGRIDEQIKIRGFRVEPGEIEASLNEHPSVRESAVVAREIGPEDARLAAYLVLASQPAPTAGEIRTFLATRLPEYMIPSTFAELPSLPLNSSGKIDRAALRSRGSDETLHDESYAAPRTATEAQLVGIVAELLKLDQVGVDDDFFMLGGHSLLGTQLIARLYDTFGVKVGLRVLFQSPTVTALASEVQRLRTSA
ncbi:MAG: Non-ribosomal peptide synthetase component [Candidatus Eremiobacteraeota bacterium]|nr:Non-ribosomal peptide synthetase component [Candidatus Eremiobacteraeota bacterium]